MPHPLEYFFADRYAEAYAAERAAEAARRSEAFLDVARPVAGLDLRPLTPHDLMILDGFASPFVMGHAGDATPDHIIAVLWLLRLRAPRRFPGLAYRVHRRTLLRRWRDPARLVADYADLRVWFDDVFADSGIPREAGGAGSRGIGTHFLAGLLVPLACEMGALDPATGRPLIESPLCRLFQYLKTLRSKKEGRDFIDFSPSDRLKGEALRVWNEMTAAQQAHWVARAEADAAAEAELAQAAKPAPTTPAS